MNTFTFQKAMQNDWMQIAQLLRNNELPLDGAEMHMGGFLLAYEQQTLVGCAALERYGDSALLRSVAVDKAVRGKGLGQALVRHILEIARTEGIKTVVLLTTTADQFFPRFGFCMIPREDAPESVKVSAEFQGACPDSAITMRLMLE